MVFRFSDFNPPSTMENAVAIASVLGPAHLVLGLSVLLYPKAWHTVMKGFQKDHLTFLPIALIQLAAGLVILHMHHVWTKDVWGLVTLVGWIALFKGAFYFLVPGESIKAMIKYFQSINMIYLGGVIAIVLGVVFSHAAYYAL